MEGRAAPMMSSSPLRTRSAIVSGFVKRPTPTSGLAVTWRTWVVQASS